MKFDLLRLHAALTSKMLICTKILIIEPSSDEIKYTDDKDNSCAVILAILACKIRETSKIISV